MVGISVSGAPHHGPSTARSETPDPNASSLVHRQRGGGGGTSVLSAEALATDLPASDRGNLSALLGYKNIRGHRAAQESVKFLESQQGQDIKKLMSDLKGALDPETFEKKLAAPWKALEREIEKLDAEDRFVIEELVNRTAPKAEHGRIVDVTGKSEPDSLHTLLPQLDANRDQLKWALLFSLLPVAVVSGIQVAGMLGRGIECENVMEQMPSGENVSGELPECQDIAHSEYIPSPSSSGMAIAADAILTTVSFVSNLLTEAVHERRTEEAAQELAAERVTADSETYQLDNRTETRKRVNADQLVRLAHTALIGVAAGGAIIADSLKNGKPLDGKEIVTPAFVLLLRETAKTLIDIGTALATSNPKSNMASVINGALKSPVGVGVQLLKSYALEGKVPGREVALESILGLARGSMEEVSAFFGNGHIDEAGKDHEEKRDTAMHNTMNAVMEMKRALRHPKITQSYAHHIRASQGDVDAALHAKFQAEQSLRGFQGKLATNFHMEPGTQLFSEALEDLGKAREAAGERIRRKATQPSSFWYTTVGSLRSSISDAGHSLSDQFGRWTGNTAASLTGPQNNMQNPEAPSMPPSPTYPAPQAPAAGNAAAGRDEVFQMDELDNTSERSEPATASAVHTRSAPRSQMERGGRAEAVLHQPISIPRPSVSTAPLTQNPNTAAAGDHRRQRM